MLGKAFYWEHQKIRGTPLGYHLKQAPYFGNALILGLYPTHNNELLVTY
jgi:hypothetical protein